MATVENIAKALVKAQAEMTKAHKGSENPHFRSKYADLGNVMDACLPALNANEIAVAQVMHSSEGEDFVVTRFIHASGESLECAVRLLIGKPDMQGMGSAITYARRYGLMMLAGIAPEDDDGNAAANNPGNKKKQPPANDPPPPAKTAEPLASDYRGRESEYPITFGTHKGKTMLAFTEAQKEAMAADDTLMEKKPELKKILAVLLEPLPFG